MEANEERLTPGSGVIFVTAFEPFGGERINPTALVLERLPDCIGGRAIRKRLLPVEFIRAVEFARAEYDRLSPSAVIMLGQAGGRSAITPETGGRNLMKAGIPDNAGWAPDGLPIAESGPETLMSTLPVDLIVRAVNAEGVPCEKSDDAGTYVCNALLYGMLYHNKGRVPTGFIHVPFIREQGHMNRPYLELEDVYKGIIAAIGAVACGISKTVTSTGSSSSF